MICAGLVAVYILVLLAMCPSSFAMPEYSDRTGQGCGTCHTEAGSTELTLKGLQYAASGYSWPPEGGYRVLGPVKKHVRLFLGFLHVTGSFIWFGTILYVHILLRPAYASKGLPRGEVLMGLASMLTVGITGAMLTASRIRSASVLFSSEWGLLLLAKMIVYAVMLFSALFVVIFIGPRLRQGISRPIVPKEGVFDPVTLSAFDGKGGRPAYAAFEGKVYDFTGLKHWGEGLHMKHRAGTDLTGAILRAPHGDEKLKGLRGVGTFNVDAKVLLRPAEKAFYAVAYMNLTLVFVVLFVVSYWRWGL